MAGSGWCGCWRQTSPARLATVLNALHAGALVDRRSEERVHGVLGRANVDVVRQTDDWGFVGDDVDVCALPVSREDAAVLCEVCEGLVFAALAGASGKGLSLASGAAVVAARGLLGDLLALTTWGALVEVTVADGDVECYRERSVGVGSGLDAARRALAQRIDRDSALYRRAVDGLSTFGVFVERMEVLSRSRVRDGGCERVVTLRLVSARLDADTCDLLAENADDDVVRVELFESAVQVVPARVVSWPLVS